MKNVFLLLHIFLFLNFVTSVQPKYNIFPLEMNNN